MLVAHKVAIRPDTMHRSGADEIIALQSAVHCGIHGKNLLNQADVLCGETGRWPENSAGREGDRRAAEELFPNDDVFLKDWRIR